MLIVAVWISWAIIAAGGDPPACWDQYMVCGESCWAAYDECNAPCEAGRERCLGPCQAQRESCELLRDWPEVARCLGGPGSTGARWCVVRDFVEVFGLRLVRPANCGDGLPEFCTYWDRDRDGDVDLFDVAQWRLGLWDGTPALRNVG